MAALSAGSAGNPQARGCKCAGLCSHPSCPPLLRDRTGDRQSPWDCRLIEPAKAANEFIAFGQDRAHRVALLHLAGYGPANPATAAVVPDDLKRIDCTQPQHCKLMHRVDMKWYSETYAAALERFTALVSS